MFTGAAVAQEQSGPPVDRRRAVAALLGIVDPESAFAAIIRDGIGSEIIGLPADAVAAWTGTSRDCRVAHVAARDQRRLVLQLLGQARPRRIDPRVASVLQHLQRESLDPGTTSLARLARLVALSPTRLMHVFTRSIGIPLRPYVLWLRVQRAARALSTGATVTEVAHQVGFADAPHLTRTFRNVLGATPSELNLARRRRPRPAVTRLESATAPETSTACV
jgi:AraC-like DNA-binding protein